MGAERERFLQMQDSKEATIDIRSIFNILYKKLNIIVISTLMITIFGSIYTFFIATPTYTASTQLVAKLSESSDSNTYAGQVTGNIQMANTMNQVIVSPIILDQVQSNLGLSNDNFQSGVTATNTTNSQVITITVTYTNPYTAQKIANETAKVFSQNADKLLNVTNVSVLAEAKANTKAVSPKPKLYIAISVLAGLIVGIGLALLLEALNNKVVREEDIEHIGLPMLGSTSYAKISDFNTDENEKAGKKG